jgi:hypothetical protein
MIPAHINTGTDSSCVHRNEELCFVVKNRKTLSLELIHAEMYQSRHFSFKGTLLGAMGIYIHTYKKIVTSHKHTPFSLLKASSNETVLIPRYVRVSCWCYK